MNIVVVAIDAAEVCGIVHNAADDMFARAVADLRLDGVRLRWFREEGAEEARERASWPPLSSDAEALYQQFERATLERLRLLRHSAEIGGPLRWITHPDVAGFVIPLERNVVWLRSDLEPGQAAYTVAHELRHVQQGKVAGDRFGEFASECREALEASAHAYARMMYNRWPMRRLYPLD